MKRSSTLTAVGRRFGYILLPAALAASVPMPAGQARAQDPAAPASGGPAAGTGAAASVPASDPDPAARLVEAELACLKGKYQRGVDILAELYLDQRHPAYLHNQARCYEQNGQYWHALGRYQEFLRKVKGLTPAELAEEQISPELITRIRDQAARLEELARQQQEQQRQQGVALGAPDGVGRASPGSTGGGGGRPAAGLDQAATASDHPRSGAWLKRAGVVAMTTGGAVLVTAVAAGVYARRAETDITNSSRMEQVFDSQRYDNGRRAALVSTVGFISGPILLGLGALGYWLGSPEWARVDRAAVRVLPTLSRSELGGALRVSY